MARNDGMDALSTLLSLGVLGSMLDSGGDADAVRRMTASGKSPIPTPGQQPKKTTPAEGARLAKEVYDSYVEAGFNEVQAFELLKAVLTTHTIILKKG